jgi:succinate dehydrogenase / fumarate reductase cytochrome b subunit
MNTSSSPSSSDERAIPVPAQPAALKERPLSPHLQVYRLPPTALASIAHRATGVFLSAGLLLLTVCAMAIAEGATSFQTMQALLASALGRLFLWGWIFSLHFHLCHGVRHLVWDTGHGFERETLDRFARVELIAAGGLTFATLILNLIF